MEDLVAEVIINIAARRVEKPFTYVVPAALQPAVRRGCRVLVPFGCRLEEGFVLEVRPRREEAAALKELSACLDGEPWFDEAALATARWLSGYYLCTLAEALRLFVPGKRSVRTERLYAACEAAAPQAMDAAEKEAWQAFVAQPAWTEAQLCAHCGEAAAAWLQGWRRRGWATSFWRGRRRGGAKTETVWSAAAPAAATQAEILSGLGRRKAQRGALEALWRRGSLRRAELPEAGISAAVLGALVEAGLVQREERRVYRRDGYATSGGGLEPLNAAQRAAMDVIGAAVDADEDGECVLHGVTGSGKTRVYLEAVQQVLARRQQAIVLVPEIGLTGQLVGRFRAAFGHDQVVVWHSRLSEGERLDAWDRIHGGEAGVIIGARSAVFAPAHRLGLVVLDEEHDGAYKQEERPRYHAREVARERCRQQRAVLLLGSATPSLESYERCRDGQSVLLSLPERATAAPLPQVDVVDMRQELKNGNRRVLSRRLQAVLDQTLAQGEQAVILLNRRGYATFVMCRECGHTMECPKCSVSLVYHAAQKHLRCHYCDHQQAAPDVCPACGSRYIRFFGSGTQKLEEELQSRWPTAQVARMDQDTMGRKHAHESVLQAFRERRYDILLGTQMVAKGHDLPFVTAVGIIAADSALHLPDFRAAERTFSLITQAAGRAGRREKQGQVVVQTYNPDHYAVEAARRQDFSGFCEEELSFRRALGYPPFCRLISLTVQDEDEARARRLAEQHAAALKALVPPGAAEVWGPCPAPLARIQGLFRMQLFLKCQEAAAAKAALVQLGLEQDPQVTVDVDPLHVL